MKKRGAMELSIGTIVIIVLAMSMLILGLVLVKSIFSGATESVNKVTDGVKSRISGLFVDEQADVVVNLDGKTANVKAGTEDFGVSFGARTKDGSSVKSRGRLQYKLSLSDTDKDSCLVTLGKDATEDLFKQKLDTWLDFDEYQDDSSFSIISFSIPKGTAVCTQKISIDVQDTEKPDQVSGAFFKLKIEKTGWF